MKNRTTVVLDTHPVILDTVLPEHNVMDELAESEQEIRHILDTHPEPLFLIFDIRQLRVLFDDLIAAASLTSRGQDPILRHPRIRGLYFVTDSAIIKMAAAGLNNTVFGNTKATVCATVEEALADIERVMAAA